MMLEVSAEAELIAKRLLDLVCPIRILGDDRCRIKGAAALSKAGPEDLAFCNFKGDRAYNVISSSQAGVIICFDDVPQIEQMANMKCIITVAQPRLAFIRCLNEYFRKVVEWGIDPTAVIRGSVTLPQKVKIGTHVYVGSGSILGEETVVEERVVIREDSIISGNVYIQSGAVIGCEGQAFERNNTGTFEKFPQGGWVCIEDDVEIGANSTVVRGTFDETRIGEGSKIGHLVDIGHNVRIGRHVFVSAGVVIAGSAEIGDFSWVAPGVVIREAVHVGKNATIGMGSVVTKSVDDGAIVVGIPARQREQYLRELEWLTRHVAPDHKP